MSFAVTTEAFMGSIDCCPTLSITRTRDYLATDLSTGCHKNVESRMAYSEPIPLIESESPVPLAKAMAVLASLGFSVTSLESESWMSKPVVEAALRTFSRASVRV